jgi:hypothetical protein
MTYTSVNGVPVKQFDERYNWCLANLGPATDYPPRWEPGELGHPLKFRFRDPKDRIMFMLRWAQCQ